MKRSTTNFDRTYATRQFDQTNKSLRDSQAFRMTQSAFTTSQKKNINKEFNMALKIIKEWVNNRGKNSTEVILNLFRRLNNFVISRKKKHKQPSMKTTFGLPAKRFPQISPSNKHISYSDCLILTKTVLLHLMIGIVASSLIIIKC